MPILFAQPYDIDAHGFYFESASEFASKAAELRNDYDQPVEEFEIQFIDGESLDSRLFDAFNVNQCTIESYFEAMADWDDDQKIRAFIAVSELGISFRLGEDDPNDLDIDLYAIESLTELAIQFVEDGLFGTIPQPIANYVDYDAIARDLSFDYGTTTIAGTFYAYRAA